LRTVLTLANLTCAEAPLLAADLPAWVDARVKELQPAADEKRFDEIGWSTSILQAEKLARERSRPIFWFTHDGRMNVGRC
jgi:hypothetical protein